MARQKLHLPDLGLKSQISDIAAIVHKNAINWTENLDLPVMI